MNRRIVAFGDRRVFFTLVCLICLILCCTICFSAYGSGGGYVEPPDDTPVSGGGGGTGTQPTCNASTNLYSIDCAGISWIFYKSVRSTTENVVHAPYTKLYNNQSKTVTINHVCSEHTGQNGGFWHYGINAKAFGSPPYFVQLGIDTNLYSTAYGKWGHWWTLGYHTVWGDGAPGKGDYRRKTYAPNSNLTHKIKDSKGNVIYEATKWGTDAQVLTDYIAACNGDPSCSYNGKGLPTGLYTFCYWDGIDGVKLEAYRVVSKSGGRGYINSSGTSVTEANSRFTNKTCDINSNCASNNAGSISGFDFRGWCVNNKDCSSPASSGSTVYTVNNISNDTKLYAVYEEIPKYKLTLKAWDIDDNKEITCNSLYPVTGSATQRGSKASVSKKDISSSDDCKNKYDFAGFAKTSADAYAGAFVTTTSTSQSEYISNSNSTYNLKSITANTTRYVAYKKKQFTLTLTSCNTDGVSISAVPGLGDTSKTVKYGSSASLTRGLSADNGYTASTFKGFVSGATDCQNAKGKTMVTTTSTSSAVYVSGSSSPKETVNVKSLTANGKIYAMYELPDLSLTRKSVDVLGNSLDSVIAPSTVTRRYGETAKVCRPDNEPSGLQYKFWAKSVHDAQNGTKLTTGLTDNEKCYEISSLTESKTVFVVYDVLFEGKSNAVSIAGSTNMDWKKENATVRLELGNCSPTSGCTAHFVHSLRQVAGYGTTNWKVYRTSNYWDGTYGAADGKNTVSVVGEGTFTSTAANPASDVFTSNDYRFKPGVVICETLEFGERIATATPSYIRTTACASATGNAQPGSVALIDVKVKNVSIEAYNSYRDGTIYAKPGDDVYFKAYYNPKLQYTYNIVPQRMRIDGGTAYDSDNKTLGTLFNEKKSDTLKSWNNAFNVICNNFNCSTGFHAYEAGDFANKTPDPNRRMIAPADVGKELRETLKTNETTNTKTTPSQVTFSESGGKNVANVITTPIDDTASVIVPYNFVTSTSIKEDDGEVAYAGEVKNVNYVVKVEEKANSLTSGTYATPVPSARSRVEVSVNGGSWESSDWTDIPGQNLNPGGGAGETNPLSIKVNVPDVPAGSQFCVKSVVWPQSSGADSNIDPNQFSGTAESPVACFVVAKKPNFQVWGGEIFINGDATVPVSQKNNLAGYDNYTVAGVAANSNYIFGSWTELGLVGNKKIKGIASGATLGYSAPLLVANPGGLSGSLTNTNNCKRNVLSFANKQCSTSVGNISASSIMDTALLGKIYNMARKLVPDMIEPNVSGSVNLNSDYSVDSNGRRYSYAAGNLSIGESNVSRGVTHIVYANTDGASANVTIEGNIVYEPGPYSDLNDIPKLFIYGKNINIACNVDRIDAVLMSDGAINTCYDSDNVNNAANSNQLRINGVIIAKSLKLMRTYGAGTGDNSIVPAEVINYDSSMYLWAMKDFAAMGEMTSTEGEVVEVFKRELAPRY